MTTTVIRTPRSRRDIVTDDPLNAHTPRAALRTYRTATTDLFVRDHFAIPHLDPATWRLRLDDGSQITYADLLARRRVGIDMVLECAGNGRSGLTPRTPGLPWDDRAVGCARFAGVPPSSVLVRIPFGTTEVVFTGADGFERALPLAVALHPDTLLATHMNGRPLTPEHGAPVRLVVPGWYGVASVKWLVGIGTVSEPFTGLFQTDQYVYRETGQPVSLMRVKSLISAPEPGAWLRAREPVEIRGWAWSGSGPITRVDVHDGTAWRPAALTRHSRYGWTGWSRTWVPGVGRHRLLARATDATGATQPLVPPWNELGYGNNAVTAVEVIGS